MRKMRRFKQQIPQEDCDRILRETPSGVLAVIGDEGYPYTVPMNFVWYDGKLYFHCAGDGHKMDAIASCDKVSFCVVSRDDNVPERFTTLYESVVVFGRAGIVSDDTERRQALTRLCDKYSPGLDEAREKEIDSSFKRVRVIRVDPVEVTGKRSMELFKAQK